MITSQWSEWRRADAYRIFERNGPPPSLTLVVKRRDSMAKTLTICSWLLVVLGVSMTAWLCPHPLAFVPYALFAFAILAARRVAVYATILVLTLFSVCVGFWFFWDAAFVHLSTLNLIPLEVAVVESLIAGTTWLVVRRIEGVTHEPGAA
jgi:hypothetical protein